MAQNAQRMLAVVTGAAGLLLVLTATARLAVETFSSRSGMTIAVVPRQPEVRTWAVEARRARLDPMLALRLGAETDYLATLDGNLTTGSVTGAKSDMEIVPAVEGRERLLGTQAPATPVLPAAAAAGPPASAPTDRPDVTPMLDIDAEMLKTYGEPSEKQAPPDASSQVIHGIISGDAAPVKSSEGGISGHAVSGVGLGGLLN
jgi:hypothetical protein